MEIGRGVPRQPVRRASFLVYLMKTFSVPYLGLALDTLKVCQELGKGGENGHGVVESNEAEDYEDVGREEKEGLPAPC